MFYYILPLLLCSKAFQNCAAIDTSDISYDTSKSNPIVRHLIKTSSLGSTIDVIDVVTKHNDDTLSQGVTNKSPKKLETHLEKVSKEDTIHDLSKNIQVENSSEDAEFDKSMSDLSKVIHSRLSNILRNRMKILFSKTFPLNAQKSESDSSENTHISSEELDKETKLSVNNSEERVPSSRQFVFHPYLPYGKDAVPDEKISIHDVLPVKMVKFIKSMVEDAPWEQMFMKMVRMVVDQFVDKIIEKMFAHKDEDDKWRSLDGNSKTATWSLPKNVLTSVVRMRRSAGGKSKSEKEQTWSGSNFQSANRVSKEDESKVKETAEEESWLDSILEYMFPEDPKANSFDDGEISETEKRKKRDANEPTPSDSHLYSEIIRRFLIRYLRFQSEQLTPETIDAIVKESIRRKMLQIIPSDIQVDENADAETTPDASSLPVDSPSEVLSERWVSVLKNVEAEMKVPTRVKRSASDDTDKEMEEERRLWQASRRTRPSNSKTRDDCSLRRACNAGRLLSRLPSVQDITLQLKAYGNEPHWDALLWGMAKKRCSRIFCKRQRSPKGSKHRWDIPEKRYHKKSTQTSRGSRSRYDESDLTTIYPV